MGRQLVPQRELSGFLVELEERGATEIQRSPARFDGTVEVRWEDSPVERHLRKAELQGWRQIMVLSAVVAALIVLTMVLLAL